ncbi:hypothetical protein KFL_009550010 [Klebsormidium nitens]|uniref:Uncharacterized protein n=1 Tax=Klebsormidium nitens TaxID=105231 RepID=A0A1Y1IQB3_KLENI|nr:hypothetical protein KFL_009550010 [Klebsormidium nitens]|eukprot:GAQ92242.1 hypothetical protein KFL_009550010 [Klebsormidium nitens]
MWKTNGACLELALSKSRVTSEDESDWSLFYSRRRHPCPLPHQQAGLTPATSQQGPEQPVHPLAPRQDEVPEVVHAAPQLGGSPPTPSPPPRNGCPNVQHCGVRTAPQPEGQPAPYNPPPQDGMRTAPQLEWQPAPPFPPPRVGQHHGLRTAPQPEKQPAPPFPPPQFGQHREVRTVLQLEGQPAPSFRSVRHKRGGAHTLFPPPRLGSLPTCAPCWPQADGQAVHSSFPNQDGLPRVVRTAPQSGRSPPAPLPPPRTGGCLVSCTSRPSCKGSPPTPSTRTGCQRPPCRLRLGCPAAKSLRRRESELIKGTARLPTPYKLQIYIFNPTLQRHIFSPHQHPNHAPSTATSNP